MASKTDICNLALMRMGVSQSLTNVDTDGTREALSCLVVFDKERDFVTRDFPWGRARAYIAPNLTTNYANPANTDWTYAYRYPADCLFVRRILTANGRQELNPPAFAIGRDPAFGTAAAWSNVTNYVIGNFVIVATIVYECIANNTNQTPPNATYWRVVPNAQVIFSDLASPITIEYTAQLTDPLQFEPEFVSMLAWRLAGELSPSLSRIQDFAKTCLEMYAAEKAACEQRAALEGQKDTVAETTDAPTLEIVNLALFRLGVTRDNSPKSLSLVASEARLANVAFTRERDFVLRDFPWPWARAFADPVLFAGDPNAPFSKDWIYAFKFPPDCFFVRRVVNPLERSDLHKRRRYQFGGDPMWPVPFAVIAGSFGVLGMTVTGPTPTKTVTIAGQAYTFVTTLSGAAYEVLIGPDSGTTALHLAEAINGGGPQTGTDFGLATVANPGVTAVYDGTTTAFANWAAVITVAGLGGLSATWTTTDSTNITLSPPGNFGDPFIGGGALLTGRLILTNEPTISIEYTRTLASPSEFDTYDRTFASMLAWRVAADLAPSRIPDPKLAEQRRLGALQAYQMEKTVAQASALREAQQEEPLEAEWIRGR